MPANPNLSVDTPIASRKAHDERRRATLGSYELLQRLWGQRAAGIPELHVAVSLQDPQTGFNTSNRAGTATPTPTPTGAVTAKTLISVAKNVLF